MLSRKNIFLISGLIILALIINLNIFRQLFHRLPADFFSPFFSAVSKMSAAADDAKNSPFIKKSKSELISELLKLQKKNEIFEVRFTVLQKLQRENQELRNLLKLPPRPNFNCVFAETILRDPVYWDKRFIVNKGSNDGITVGNIVLMRIPKQKNSNFTFAVVGRIKSVSRHSAVVNTILSEDCHLSVILPISKAAGIIKEGGRDSKKVWTKIQYLPRDLHYSTGEPVFTSGLSRWTPPSLIIGNLLAEDSHETYVHDNLYMEAKLEPAADFDDLRFVIILVPRR